jgi:cytochrome b involved in lipid metabolism
MLSYTETKHSERAHCHGAPSSCASRRKQVKAFQEQQQHEQRNEIDMQKLPIYTSKQVSEHNGQHGGRIWMSFGGFVYDVTDFIPLHPGGTERISRAAGAAIEPFWHLHQQHYATEQAMEILNTLVIGRLKVPDQTVIDEQLEHLRNEMDRFRLSLEIHGTVQELSLEDLKTLIKTDRTSQVGCAQSGRGVSTSLFGGVLLKHLIGEQAKVKQVVFQAMDGETVTLDTDTCTNYEDILVSFEENGAPLTQGRGFPLRVIIPGKRVVKWVTRIQVV